MQVKGQVGRKKSFEILVNNQEIHSKLKTMSFPNFEEVVSIIKTVSEGGDPSTVLKTICRSIYNLIRITRISVIFQDISV